MLGDDWILGWIVDGLAKRFGQTTVAGWITIGALLVPLTAIVVAIAKLAF